MKAEEFAALIGAKLTLPSRPLLHRKEGEARGYFTHTNVSETFERMRDGLAPDGAARVVGRVRVESTFGDGE
jgi:hypothetical protein